MDASATDSASNTNDADQVTVAVDNVDDDPAASIVNPTDGSTVSGTVTIQVDATDDRDVQGNLDVKVSIDSGTPQTATYNSTSSYYELYWDTTGLTDGTPPHTIGASATDSGSNTTNAGQVTVTVDNSVASTMHIGDLDGQVKGNWKAVVTVTIHDDNSPDHNLVANATVSGTWFPSGKGAKDSCTTDITGTCEVNSGKQNGATETTFTVTGVTHATITYEPLENQNPDGDSVIDVDGTIHITVFK